MFGARDTNGKVKIETLPVRMLALEDAAFQEFADYFGPPFRALFIRHGLPPVDAEDLAISCITDIAMRVRKYKRVEGKSFAAWVFKIAKNAMVDWWKNAGMTREGIQGLQQLTASGSHDNECPRHEVVCAVQEALFALTAQQREIIFLRDLEEERSYAEIGTVLQIPEGTARVRHKRALENLRSILVVDPRIQPIIAACSRRLDQSA